MSNAKSSDSKSFFFVLKGRFRTMEEFLDSDEERIREFGPWDCFGALDVYTGNLRQASVFATRRSEVIRLQKSSYLWLINRCPSLGLSLWKNTLRTAPDLARSEVLNTKTKSAKFRTIAILPVSAEVPIERFISLLSSTLIDIGIYTQDEIVTVGSDVILDSVGHTVYSKVGKTYLEEYLAHLQENVQLSILLGDHATESTWNGVCIANVS